LFEIQIALFLVNILVCNGALTFTFHLENIFSVPWEFERISPLGKIAKIQSKECVFVNSAFKLQCHIVKNTLLHTAFSAILPTGS